MHTFSPTPNFAPRKQDSTFILSCELPTISDAMCEQLRRDSFQTPSEPLHIIIDAPIGFALDMLYQPIVDTTLVLSWNGCPEYWDALWERQPHLLVVNDMLLLEQAVHLATHGYQGRFCPPLQSVLSRTEQLVLRELGQGRSTKAIAAALALREKTVRNNISHIYSKLQLHSPVDAYRYYWGIWHRDAPRHSPAVPS